jgi:hypothetical protein
MFQNDIASDFSARQERYKDLRREAERERLIRAIRFQQPGNRGMQRKVVGYIGVHIVKWGSKLYLCIIWFRMISERFLNDFRTFAWYNALIVQVESGSGSLAIARGRLFPAIFVYIPRYYLFITRSLNRSRLNNQKGNTRCRQRSNASLWDQVGVFYGYF